MIQVRNGTFETNSSSTHSICISKKPVDVDGGYIDFYLGEYGWEYASTNAANYLYTAIMSVYDAEMAQDKLDIIKDILDKHGIKYTFEPPVYDKSGYLENGYIDHDYETCNFINAVLNDEDLLLRCLFGDSVVYTGNDNGWDFGSRRCDAANEWRYVKEGDDWKREKVGNWGNPYYDPDHYDYFYKGN